MTELDDLYQEVILDHYKRPRNFGRLPEQACSVHGENPLCGDRLVLDVKVKDEVIEDLKFQGSGCAISTASASMMTEAVKGRRADEARALFGRFHALVTGVEGETGEGLGKLAAFAGVRDYPVRVKCASLAWHTLKAALDGGKETVSTE